MLPRTLAASGALLLIASACLTARSPKPRPREIPERFADLAEHGRPTARAHQPAEAAPAPERAPEAAPEPQPEAPPPPLVARLELEAPRRSPFVLRATLPVPRGVFPTADGREPFAIVGHGPERGLVAAQTEGVSRYPTGDADVVLIQALVELAEDVRPGTRVRYNVVLLEEREVAAPPPPAEAARALLDPRGAATLALRCVDVHGNVYELDLRGDPARPGFGGALELAQGPLVQRRRTHGVLMPAQRSGAGDPLPHMMGAHAYLVARAGEERVSLDLRVHASPSSGARAPERGEEPLGIFYWRSLELVVPAGWRVEPLAADPYFAEAREEGGLRVVPLVAPPEGDALHVLGPGMQFHRRLDLVPEAAPEGEHSALEGLAYCVAGPGLWSWFEPQTARYFPQRALLGHFDEYERSGHRGTAGLRTRLQGEYEELRALLASGGTNDHDVTTGVLGWAHPWLQKHGGMTGGGGIELLEGHEAAAVASKAGYGRLLLRHRMNASRHPEAFFTLAGEPAGVEAWLEPDTGRITEEYRSNGNVRPRAWRLPALGGPAPAPQVEAVHAAGLRPPWDEGTPQLEGGEWPSRDDVLWAWSPHDGQHLVRYTKQPQALVWLGGDALARDDLAMAAHLFRLMFHGAPGDGEGGVSLADLERQVAAAPHQGAWLTRDHAFGLDTAAAHYSVASPEERALWLPWFQRVGRLLVDAAMPSGIVMRIQNERILGHERHDAAYTFQSLFLLHALRCLTESVLRGVDDELATALDALVLRASDYLYFGPVWREQPPAEASPADPEAPAPGAPASGFAVAPADGSGPPYSDASHWGEGYLPEDGLTEGTLGQYGWFTLDWAAHLSQDSAGAGLQNRYLQRLLQLNEGAAGFDELVRELWRTTYRASSDLSSQWIELAARMRKLGA